MSTCTNENPTLCIPRILNNITSEHVKNVFKNLDIGQIHRIDLVPHQAGDKFSRVFIHFHHWYNTNNAKRALNLIMTSGEFKVIYDGPWFWKVSAAKKHERVNR